MNNKPVMLKMNALAAFLLGSLLCSATFTAEAASGRITQPKLQPTPVKAQKAPKAKESLKKVNSRMDTLVKQHSDQQMDGRAKATLQKTHQQAKLLRKDLTTTKSVSMEQYASSRGKPLRPAPALKAAPPVGTAGPAKTDLLAVPERPTQPLKSFRPPGNTVKVTECRECQLQG